MTTSLKSAFTLIELSIVIVIIGLLAGGVLVGKDLIAYAEMRRFISDYQEYESAYNTFKLKYNCIPGDCVGASTDFWSWSLGGATGEWNNR